MAEVVRKEMTNCRDPNMGGGYERIEVRVRSDEPGNIVAINLASRALLGDLANFEPPITNVDESMVRVELLGDDVRAEYVRGDPMPLEKVPSDYQVDGYPFPAESKYES